MIQLLLLGSFCGAILLLVTYLIINSKTKEKESLLVPKKPSSFKLFYNRLTQKIYVFTLRIPGVRRLVILIRRKIETVSSLDEYTLRREIMTVLFTIVTLAAAIIIGFSVFRPSWIVMVWVVIGIAFLIGVVIDLFVYRVEYRLLEQIKDYNGKLRYFYQQTKMIDESVYEAGQLVGPEMKKQAERMYDILMAADPYAALQEYENVAPSRFLKVIAGLQLLVKDQGDVRTDKGSAFLAGLTSLNEELNNDMLYRSKLHYKLRGLTAVATIPMFFALPLKNWAVAYFPSMNAFYSSWLGMISQAIVYITIFLCFILIRKMKEVNEEKYQATLQKKRWEEVLLRFKPFAKLIELLMPSYFQKKHFQLSMLIKESNSPLKLEWLYVRRVLMVIVTFVLVISMSVIFHAKEKKDALSNSLPVMVMVGGLTDKDLENYKELTAFDREVLISMSNGEIDGVHTLRETVSDKMGMAEDDKAVTEAMERIVEKYNIIENAFVKWWEVLLAIALAALAYHVPVAILMFQRNMRKKEMENEVNQFYILVGILREFDRMSVDGILTWMERFSVVFKDVIREGLNDYDSGPELAIAKMKSNVSFEGFHQLMDRLELSVVRISIQEAFDDSDVERDFFIAQRKEQNERTINEKSFWGELFGLAPIYVMIFLYLIAPFLYISIAESGDLLKQIQ